MDEAGVEISPALVVVVAAEVPERVNPVRVVEMRIHAEDLTEARTDVVEERFRKTCILAKPISACQDRKRCLKISRSSSDWSFGQWCIEAARSESGGAASNSRRIDGEYFRVLKLPSHPSLNQRDVLGRGDRNWLFLVVKPGISMSNVGQKRNIAVHTIDRLTAQRSYVDKR